MQRLILWQTPQGRYAATDRNLFTGRCCSQKLLDNTSCFLTGRFLISSNPQPRSRSCWVHAGSRAAESRAPSPGRKHDCMAGSAPWLGWWSRINPSASFGLILVPPLHHTLPSATGDASPYFGHKQKRNTWVYFLIPLESASYRTVILLGILAFVAFRTHRYTPELRALHQTEKLYIFPVSPRFCIEEKIWTGYQISIAVVLSYRWLQHPSIHHPSLSRRVGREGKRPLHLQSHYPLDE